jgi:hypothetical protein
MNRIYFRCSDEPDRVERTCSTMRDASATQKNIYYLIVHFVESGESIKDKTEPVHTYA